ncbi:hypothetical protein OJAV_G00132210 [Oryzias javanicus]|uniref:Uncharacterized protein n=1 Tax=Oryzias javanicus TaxID=123683 RepID=A0A437CQD0_ORYJA|nr:hypothetical protein OJAV_G00132210 [Oryzias javanicus]
MSPSFASPRPLHLLLGSLAPPTALPANAPSQTRPFPAAFPRPPSCCPPSLPDRPCPFPSAALSVSTGGRQWRAASAACRADTAAPPAGSSR